MYQHLVCIYDLLKKGERDHSYKKWLINLNPFLKGNVSVTGNNGWLDQWKKRHKI